MDLDKNNQLTQSEFNSKIKYFYFGMFEGTFANWDLNSDSHLEKNKFHSNAQKTSLESIRDTTSDKKTSERELAGGMFYLCDENGNSQVDVMELIYGK